MHGTARRTQESTSVGMQCALRTELVDGIWVIRGMDYEGFNCTCFFLMADALETIYAIRKLKKTYDCVDNTPIAPTRSMSPSRLVLSSAGIATLALVLRCILSKGPMYISSLQEVGRLAAEKDPEEYDIIIVGGGKSGSVPFCGWLNIRTSVGTAGCALASRLSEDPSIRVLVLEAGGRFVSTGI